MSPASQYLPRPQTTRRIVSVLELDRGIPVTSSERFVASWNRLRESLEREDVGTALPALRDWIGAWDDCFWAREFDAFPVAYHDDVEIILDAPLLASRTERGISAIEQLREEISDVISFFRFDVTGIQIANERFAGVGSLRAKNRFAGVLRFPIGVVWTLRGPKIARIQPFTSRRGALRELAAPRTEPERQDG
jgi:hypothetical protein